MIDYPEYCPFHDTLVVSLAEKQIMQKFWVILKICNILIFMTLVIEKITFAYLGCIKLLFKIVSFFGKLLYFARQVHDLIFQSSKRCILNLWNWYKQIL